jgi:hypothetical protein
MITTAWPSGHSSGDGLLPAQVAQGVEQSEPLLLLLEQIDEVGRREGFAGMAILLIAFLPPILAY